ncbi:MAG TPA: SDR family NAD(P)-dependent oxidoreductase [Thermoanaerobaculia bacterium]|jgi:polyketide synthase PksM
MQANEQLADGSVDRQVRAADIAIIGMACRFPYAEDYDEYWRNIAAGRNCIREVPAARWNWREYAGEPRADGKGAGLRWGGFIDDIDKFDPLFFGIAPNEAAFIDPQHRLFLEAAWHAVEDAGYSVASLSGKAVGVYAGVSKNDYSELMRESRHDIAPYISTGTVHSILANRVSFLFNLRGRSEAVDTACSSSLVALHNAIRDIQSGECEAAIVGGVNALITPTMFISHSKSGMLSPDGQCKTFSAAANGYVRAEGVGVLFIKPLRLALRDRDHVHAVIKSSAVNHGGRSNFLTSPSTAAQAAVVMSALRRGSIDPGSMDYIEAHGTGTPLGDPIEIDGLKKAFAQLAGGVPAHGEGQQPYCAVGSVKTNVGHLESASGMAGIIKVVMAMKHRQIPAIRNFYRLNPYLELEGSPFFIATETAPWEARGHARRAGVSSFGMGGVNAHVVLEEAPQREAGPASDAGDYVIPLSARKGRLKAYAASLLDHLQNGGSAARLALGDIAFTLQAGRDVFDERLAIVSGSVDELIAGLDSYVTDGVIPVRHGDQSPSVRLAAQWMEGAKVTWSDDSARAPRRVPLPTYPFARKRCWFTDVGAKALHIAVKSEPGRSVTTLKATDFFIRDHVVQGRAMLPGVMHLELARAAAPRSRVLKNVYWITPIVVEGDDVQVEVKLTPQNDETGFEVVRNGTVHSKGRLTDLPPDPTHHQALDIPAVQSRCGVTKSKAELYALLEEHGLAYGSSFQVIESCVLNEREIVAELKLPEEVRDTAGNYELHPSMMDGVFQAITVLSLLGLQRLGEQFIPFYLESAEIVSPTTDRCLVYATVKDGGKLPAFHASLSDAEGNVLVDVRNLQKRPITAGRSQEAVTAMPRDVYYRPVWRERELDPKPGPATKSLLLFADDENAVQSFRQYWPRTISLVLSGAGYRQLEDNVYEIDLRNPADYERLLQELKARELPPAQVAYLWSLNEQCDNEQRDGLDLTIYAMLHFTQAAFKVRFRENVNLVYVHGLRQGHVRPIHSMVGGFARTLKYENPKFDYHTLGTDATLLEDVARYVYEQLGSSPNASPLQEVTYRDGHKHDRVIVREAVAAQESAGALAPILKAGGVYLISGGAGGLGAVVSRHLAERYRATILWLGRSEKSAALAGKIADIGRAGGTCEYFSVDITDRKALTEVFARIKSAHPEINGVIHAAGVIEDAFILRKQKESFARVVEPKVLGAIHLDALTQNEKLDFFVVFSSVAALMPNQGQCDYAAANSFLDAFAAARNELTVDKQRSGVTLALNWPLWAQGGMRVTPEEERHFLRVFGMKPLATADGLEILEIALALASNRFPEIHQLIAVGGNRAKIERSLGVDTTASPTVELGVDEAQPSQLETEIRSIFAARLGVPSQTITDERTLGELGVDSLALIGVIRDINERFGTDLRPTLLFDINTIGKLATHLVAIGRSKVVIAASNEAPRWNRSLIDVAQSDAAARVFRRTFRTSEFYLRDHVVDGQYNMPGACYLEMARQAGDLLWGDKSVKTLLHNYWASPLSSPEEDFTAHVQLTPKQNQLTYEIVSVTPAGEKRLHAMGQMTRDAVPTQAEARVDLGAVTSRCDEIQYPVKIYEQIHREGLHVGVTFQPMTQICLNDAEALAALALPEEVQATSGDYVLHPALLTGVFQTALISNRRATPNSRQYIPIGMDELEVLAPIPAECHVYCRTRPSNARNEEIRKFDLEVCQPDGLVVVRLKGFSIRALKEAAKAADTIETVEEPARSESSEVLIDAVRVLIQTKLASHAGVPAEEIEWFVPFDQYGVTSVMVVELNQTFEDILGSIPKTLFFEYRTIAELAEYFVENHAEVLARLLVERTKPVPAVVASADRNEPTDEARVYLRSLIAGPIGLAAEEIDFQASFDEYGVNSVMVVELNEIFETVFGPLSKTLFFEYRSIDELSRYFLEEYRDKLLAALPPKPVAVGPRKSDDRPPAGGPARASDELPQTGSHVHRASGDERRDIAIVSAAGRFPGARDLEQFWDVLKEGRDCITEIPPDRFNYRKYFDADPEQNGIYGKWGGFISDVDRFDPGFFGISPREAELIDPQERLLLEVVWEMLERAGYTRSRLHRLSNGRVGVFVGALWQPYESAGIEATLAGNVVGPSSLLYSIANRVSYFFDLVGPSMAIDTACSSSLTALHLACQSIRDGESQFAIAAGVNLSLSVSKYLFLSRYRFLSTDGRCRSYGAGGDGYVPGEGVCALLLKPLAKAVAEGDSVLAVIKGSAINHGGRTNGYTVPNPKSQGNVIATALESSRIDPRSISYIEGHGTGTSLGDPIEIAGLEKALGLSKESDRFCAIGSVKSNIGHLEAAAGIASVIKVILQMQHGQLAPSLHSEQLNPNIDFARSPFRVQRELAPWPRPTEHTARSAGVSSFGAGGSNAHLILQEYDGPLAPVARSNSHPGIAALCVFSARNEERLFELVGRFSDYLREASPDLHELAYTLQLGREAMRERLAVVAATVGDLRVALADFLAHTRQQSNWRRGRVAGRGAQTDGIRSGHETPEAWWEGKSLFDIAEAWAGGRNVDWAHFYDGRNYAFLPLPTYPFARERYWLDMAAGEPARATNLARPAPAVLHPLLHRELGGQRYSSTFTGEEFFLADHQVLADGRSLQKVLPAVACLEMARAAIERAFPAPSQSHLELRNSVWLQPIVVSHEKEIGIALSASGNDEIEYTIYSRNGAQEVLHCQGRAGWRHQSEPIQLDLERLERRMAPRGIDADSVYSAFVRTGGLYGPSFQGIVAIHQGAGQLLASLRLPAVIDNTFNDYVLHPTLMDSALQGYLGLIDDWFDGSGRTRMPFALESLHILAPCTREMVAWMRFAPGSHAGDQVVKLDIDLCDASGRTCVRMKGFSVRALIATKEREEPAGLMTLAPMWDAVQPPVGGSVPAPRGRVVVIGGDEQQHRALSAQRAGIEVLQVNGRASVEEIAEKLHGDARIDHLVWILPVTSGRLEHLIADQEDGVLLGFRLIKALLREGYGASELGWTVVTSGTEQITALEKVSPSHSSVQGLIGSMAKEYRNWKVRLIDVAGSVWPWRELLELTPDERGDGYAYREGQWYRRRLLQCDVMPGKHSEFKRAGVYVIVGGAGGVGEVVSEYLIRSYDARVVWIGRRSHDDVVEKAQERVAPGVANRPLYIAADARSREDLSRVREEIKDRYGRINGVIHSAIVLADKSLANMEEEQFREALSTKVDTAVQLAHVFGREPLDFILYFSSLQSFLKAPGQSNYAAGCTFSDTFAAWQSASAGYPVKVMNWGYWGTVGIVAAPEFRERMARMGWGSLGAAEGMAGIERLLSGPLDQIGMIRTDGPQAALTLGIETGETIWTARDEAPSLCEDVPAHDPPQELTTWEEQRRDFDAVLAELLSAQMAPMGEEPRVTGDYEHWLVESRHILHRYGHSLDTRTADKARLWSEWERTKNQWNAEGMRAQVALVETTLLSLEAILRGEKRATDVMFPNSSLALVEGVYKNNAVADYLNRVMENVVRWYTEERRKTTGPKLRLLELGAGTGGSSQGILQTLDAYRDHVEEYCYSDVSKLFLLHGEKAYGPGRDYLTYAVIDVEKGLPEQGVQRGTYDVVIAANVLHATKRLRETLRNAKTALKANGLLILNEITAKSVFMHLTFGLLSGWWAFEDGELRMDGSPGLTTEAWKRVLEEEGFRGVSFPAHEAHGLGQQIIVAESDGIIRQKHSSLTQRRKKLPAFAPSPSLPAVATSAEFVEKMEAWLVDAVGVLLKVKRENVDLDAELSEFGFDSISLTGFANHVNHAFALELMPTIFFEHPTVRRFAGYLAEKHGRQLLERFGGRARAVAATPRLLEDVEQWLIEVVGVLLKVKREDVDADAELSEFGFDSISLTGFANHVNQAYALELMPTIFFEYPTVRSLAGYLVEKHPDRLVAKFGVAEAGAQEAPVAKVARSVPPPRTEVVDATEAIAIIGMSGRFPGAEDLDAFWENLKAGKESVREIPPERWDWRAMAGEAREDGSTGGAQWGAFIEGVDQFDPLFFGISPREAERIDPQHRLTMMYGWKAFEDAGYGPKQLSGSRTAIFIGTTSTGYGELLFGAGIEGYTATGLVPSVGPNRLSYLLNLHGPSEPIETACSSSLVAIHRAVRSIMAGDCDMALVGGVNTLFPTLHTSFNKAGMLSPDGKCKTFSSHADGYARGEGVGMVVLKKLSAAERDGDHIYGLIRASAENHGGRAQSLTAPNPVAQAELIKDAYRRAAVSPRSVTYIEAHGTGTPLGDPIEINGLKSAFQSLYDEAGEKAAAGYCGLGSVKTNIGHLELAAGIAGLIKTLLQLKHGTLVRSLHSEEVNPYIRLEDSPFYIVKENQPWERSKDENDGEWPRRAGISSFGFGGVNAHILVEEYAGAVSAGRDAKTGPVMVVLSARTAERLQEQAIQLRQWIEIRELSDSELASVAYTLQVGREAMEHRLAITAGAMKELAAKLDDFIEGKSGIEGLYRGEVKRNSDTLTLFRGDDELREAVGKWIQRGKWSKLSDLWVKGLEIEWEQFYGEEPPRRVSLPTYPFAKVRCWIDRPATRDVPAGSGALVVLHPLLHRNTSDLNELRYSSTFSGEEFFLTDHQIRNGRIAQKVLPGVAYLEMARAAIRLASPRRESSILELRDVVWLKPVIVTEPKQVSITLSGIDDGSIDYEIYSVEAGQETVHCQGRAVFTSQPAPARLDIEQLRREMGQGRLEGSAVYAICDRMGLHYGPAHRGIMAIDLGDKQLLAQLRMPACVASNQHEHVLHPSVMDSALQASLGLLVDLNDIPGRPPVPFAVDSVRIVAAPTAEMSAWVRHARNRKPDDKTITVDIDLCDQQGNVCVQIRGLAARQLDVPVTISHRIPLAPGRTVEVDAPFDDAFYESLIADVVNHRVSVDEAVELE